MDKEYMNPQNEISDDEMNEVSGGMRVERLLANCISCGREVAVTGLLKNVLCKNCQKRQQWQQEHGNS